MNSDTAHCYRPFVALFFAAPGKFQCKFSGFLDVQKNCIASHCTFSAVNMVIFKSYLDLHLSESDWCGFVVQFGLSDLSEKHSESAFVRSSCTLDMFLDSSACGLKKLGPHRIRRRKTCWDRGSRCIFCDIHNDYEAQMCSATHLHAMCAVFTRQRSAVRHTSLRSAQYLQRGGLFWDTPPRDLHSNC